MSTPTERSEVYLTRRWQSLRLSVLSAAGWLCQCEVCRSHGYTKPAELVHHVRPWQRASGALRQQLAFDRANLIAVSRDCHARIHQDDGQPPETKEWAKVVQSLIDEA